MHLITVRNIAFIAIGLVTLSSCNQPAPNNNDKLLTRIDSLESEVRQLKMQDTVAKPAVPPPATAKPATDTLRPPSTPPPPKRITSPTAPNLAKTANDTLYYKYTNGKVSVKITPWVNSKRSILLFSPTGAVTYTMQEVRQSYSISISLSFKPNGAVNTANSHENPGASMYWYEGVTTFNEYNEPLTQVSTRMPQESLEDVMNNKPQVWDKDQKKWVKQ